MTSSDIAEALEAQHGIVIDRRKIQMDGAIKQFGKYDLEVKLYPEISGTVHVLVSEK